MAGSRDRLVRLVARLLGALALAALALGVAPCSSLYRADLTGALVAPLSYCPCVSLSSGAN